MFIFKVFGLLNHLQYYTLKDSIKIVLQFYNCITVALT